MNPYATALRLLHLLVKQGKFFWGALGVVVLVSFLQPLRPYLYKYVIDEPLRSGNAQQLLLWGVVLIALTLTHAGLQNLQALSTQKLSWRLTQALRRHLLEKVLHMPIATLEKYPVGILYTRTLTDTQTLQGTLSETFLVIAGETLQILFIIALMFLVDVKLALITLMVLPVGLWASAYFSGRIRNSFVRVRRYISRMNGFLQDFLQSRELTESIGARAPILMQFHRINRAFYLSYRVVIGYFAWFFPVMESITLLGLTAVLLGGAYLIYKGETTTGALIAFTLYQQMFFRPFRIIADQVNSLQMGLVSADRIFQLLDRAEREPSRGFIPSQSPPYMLEVKQVSFGYTPEKKILEGFSYTFEPGKIYGVRAPTGTGKSTLFYLMLGYYEPQAGDIRLGGISIADWDKRKLRQLIAYIPQEPVLFEGTLRENLTLYQHFTDKELYAAAERIGIRSHVENWPLNAEVKGTSGGFSPGEKQIIALWRAALHQPAVWILDEPTAHIDPAAEAFIYARLRSLAQSAIVLVVSHRPDVHQYCDIVVEFGVIHAA
ncbi:MAG: ABC transporter ATP-binding protein/permease [Bacteroidia bacterium]|nr:ABC transporter ATP-binding protein/permease [Bacteroidia bacterium]MDW8236193.1 ABC transporter ATP-binding protein [Bacteroidia bacterium]